MAIFDFVEEPREDTYRQLLAECATLCSTALLVVRGDGILDEAGMSLLAGLQDDIISKRLEIEWPGTRVLSAATVYRLNLDARVLLYLQNAVRGLYEWQEPLPEDLCFLRADGSPVLTTIAHESEGYVDLSGDELTSLQRRLPDLALLPRP